MSHQRFVVADEGWLRLLPSSADLTLTIHQGSSITAPFRLR
ncbi:hypothetical protein [Ornithinimicrobium cerasi]|nr:hypothetical protein [Ornithinimicrobium cerasi]